MELEFDVKMTVPALYDYNMHYTYTSASGILGTAVGAGLLILYLSYGKAIYLAFAVLLILYSPVTLYTRARSQVKLNPLYKNAIHYKMADNGVTVSVNDEELTVAWDDMYKAQSTNQSIILYTGKKTAWVFPKAELKENRYDLIEMISTHMPPEKVKIKQ